mmetsp:Transcript_19977/g.46378  ORF Transcript_19977/g.46378 Transcript_19977/m.46378 type:complete len:225 (-) Transcript_19977:1504-2178(-)
MLNCTFLSVFVCLLQFIRFFSLLVCWYVGGSVGGQRATKQVVRAVVVVHVVLYQCWYSRAALISDVGISACPVVVMLCVYWVGFVGVSCGLLGAAARIQTLPPSATTAWSGCETHPTSPTEGGTNRSHDTLFPFWKTEVLLSPASHENCRSVLEYVCRKCSSWHVASMPHPSQRILPKVPPSFLDPTKLRHRLVVHLPHTILLLDAEAFAQPACAIRLLKCIAT